MSIPTDLLTPREAARLVKAHLSTVHRWIHTGKLRAYRRGPHRYLVSQADLEALLRPVTDILPPSPAAQNRAHEAAIAQLRAMGVKV